MLLLLLLFIIISSIFLTKKCLDSKKYYDIFVLPMIIAFLSLLIFINCLIVHITANTFVNKKIQKSKIEYESIINQIKELENDNEDVSSIEVIKEISKWNQKVLDYKYGRENPWTSLFYNKKYANSLKYIDWKK